MLKISLNILEFGAIGDSIALDSPAINAALSACEAEGGGRVVVPAGLYHCGPIQLRSNVELHLEAGALIQFSRDFDDYPLCFTYYEGQRTVRCRSPLWGAGLENVAITGLGIFDGQGEAWRPVKKMKLTAQEWEKLCAEGGVVDNEKNIWWPTLEAMQGEGLLGHLRSNGGEVSLDDYVPARDFLRPNMVQLVECQHVLLDGPTFQNSPAWNVHLLLCENVEVRNVQIYNPWFAQNGDGLDIESCRNVSIQDCTLDVGDDAICLKSGKDAEGRRLGRPCENITISGCKVLHGHGGVVVGSEMSGGVRDVLVRDCEFHGTDVGLRFKTCRGRGGVVENIEIHDISMSNIGGAAISFDMYYMGTAWGEGGEVCTVQEPINEGTPVFRNVSISNVSCEGAKVAIEMRGLSEMPIEAVTITGMKVRSELGVQLQDISNITLKNIQVEVNRLPAMNVHNVQKLSVVNFDGKLKSIAFEPKIASLPKHYPWTPDCGDGTFCNPIIDADYSDPDIVRHGDEFYLIASSFNCTPALPILHSRDLVNWTLINHAVKNLPHPRYEDVQTGCGVWAPAIRFHDGKFWIFFPMPDEGIFVTTATDPAGEWSEPWCVLEGKGFIDPCPLWDEDGQAYLIIAFAKSRCGIKHRLSVYPMAPDASAVFGEAHIVYDDEEKHPTLEGPKFLKKDGWYYIIAPAGGVKTGWQAIFRSRHIYGPYEDKIVLAQGSTPINGPHQGGLVDLPNGDWWFVHFQDAYVYGRIVHLQPVEWVDGWPLMGVNRDQNGCGEPVLHSAKPQLPAQPIAIPATSDEFEDDKLGLQWQWEANHQDDWVSLSERSGFLRLFAKPLSANDLRQTPHLLGQKFPARSFTVETRLELSASQAGLFVMGHAHAAIILRQAQSGFEIVYLVDGEEKEVSSVTESSLALRVEVAEGALCRFAWQTRTGEWCAVEPAFQAREGGWIGARIGIFCAGEKGHADFEYFRFSSFEESKNSANTRSRF